MRQFVKYLSLGIFLFLQITTYAQEKLTDSIITLAGDTIVIEPIAITNVNSEIEVLSKKVINVSNDLIPKPDILKIDTLVAEAMILLVEKEQHIEKIMEHITIKNVEDLKKEWESYKELYYKWKDKINKRTVWFEKEIEFVDIQIIKWKLTQKTVKAEKKSVEIIKLINEILKSLKKLKKELVNNQSKLIVMQNGITELLLNVDRVMSHLESILTDLQSQFFIKDSPYLWEVTDSTIVYSRIRAELKASLDENIRVVNVFLPKNRTRAIYHLLLIIALILLLIFMKRKINNLALPEDDRKYQNAKYITYHYISTSLLLGFLIAPWFYTEIPTTITELIVLLLLIPTVVLLPVIAKKKLKFLLFVIIFLFVFNEVFFFYQPKLLIARIILVIENLVLIFTIYKIVNPKSKISSDLIGKWWMWVIRLLRFSLLLFAASVLSNVFGFMKLAILLNKTVVIAMLYAMVLSLLVIVINSAILILLKTDTFQLSKIIFKFSELVEKRILEIVQITMVFIWMRAVLKSTGFLSNVDDAIIEMVTHEWGIGAFSFSFGGILGFFLVIIATYVLAKVTKLILEEEIFPRIELPRGVPWAISMLTGYVIVAVGIFVALSSLGIYLSEFSLMAGALGIGIGFGLQNVVYNFIAGLILAFERPIQIGDTVEVGNLMGNVKSIGVRSSTVRTFDGSEVIVPNGNLISNELINWSLSDKRRRREVKVGVAYGTHPQDVLDLLFKVADSHERVLKVPKPLCLFDSFGENSLDFRLLFWVPLDSGLTIQSEVTMAVYKAIEEAGMQIPYPQHDLHIKSFDPTVQKIVFPKLINKDKEEGE